MKPRSEISDPRVIKALTHPLRVQILRALEERVASPSELAEDLGAPLGNVSYHVRQLHSLGLIKLVRKTPRRGAIEHHYEALAQAPIEELVLDDRGFEDAAKELARAQERLAKIRDDAAKRLAKSGGRGRPANVALLLFEAAPV